MWKLLEKQLSSMQGKEQSMHTLPHNISQKWKVYCCNFQLFLFENPPLKNWPCRSVNWANMILKFQSIFMHTQQNSCPAMCIYFGLLLSYQLVSIFTFHYTARSALLKWAMSGTCHILASSMSATALHKFSGGSHSSKFSFCFRRVYKLTMFLNSVNSDTTNQESTLTRTKQSTSTRILTKCQFCAAVTPLPRSDFAPQAMLTPLSRSSYVTVTPLTQWRPFHAPPTQLWRPSHAAKLPPWRRSLSVADAPLSIVSL